MATLTKEITTYNSSNVANGKLRLTFEYSQNVVANTSTVKLVKVEFQSSTQTGTLYADGVISMKGEVQVTYSNSGYAQDKCVLTALNTYAQLGYTLDNAAVTIYHNASGVGSIPVYLGPRSSTGYSQWNIFNSSVVSGSAHIATGTVSVALPTIADTLATATPLSPINSVEDGSAAITLRWSLSNASGIAPTKTDLQISTDGSTWSDLATVTGGASSYAVPGDTFAAGSVYWRARAYNRDNVAGSWSAAVSFIVIAAPAAPTVLCDGAPFATITWRGNGQQAYRVTVDGKVYGPFFGTDKSFTLRDYLADGEHSVSVEIQGSYGLWSTPGVYDFTVENVPGDPVTLSVRFGIDAELSWTTESAVADFLIYRDGVQVGHTNSDRFVDRLSLGKRSFSVVNRLADGNYTRSNVVTGLLWLEGVAIAAFSGGEWVYLPLSDKSDREQAYTRSRDYSLRHITGAKLPFLEISPYEDRQGSYDCAFRCEDQAAPLLALLGSPVIVKARGKNVLVGPFASVNKVQGDFFVSFSFTVPASHYEDYVDAAG